MSIEIKAFSCTTLVEVASLKTGDHFDADASAVACFCQKLIVRSDSFNIELRYKDEPIHRVLKVSVDEVEGVVHDMVKALQGSVDAGEICVTCKNVLKYGLVTEEETAVWVRALGMVVRVSGIYEAKCVSCGQRHLRFEKVTEMVKV